MTFVDLLLGIFFSFCLYFGYRLAVRRPWDGKLGTWKLDPAVSKARRKHSYKPMPDHCPPGWKRPSYRSYCFRCGTWPYTGPELMINRHEGLMFICSDCATKANTTVEDLKRYAHQVVDMRICQNFDPYWTRPINAESITYFEEMWTKLQIAVINLEATRG